MCFLLPRICAGRSAPGTRELNQRGLGRQAACASSSSAAGLATAGAGVQRCVEATQPPVKVLLIEDDLDTLELLAELLSDRFEVRTAGSAEDALEQLSDYEADVLITE